MTERSLPSRIRPIDDPIKDLRRKVFELERRLGVSPNLALSQLVNVNAPTPDDQAFLVFNAETAEWEPSPSGGGFGFNANNRIAVDTIGSVGVDTDHVIGWPATASVAGDITIESGSSTDINFVESGIYAVNVLAAITVYSATGGYTPEPFMEVWGVLLYDPVGVAFMANSVGVGVEQPPGSDPGQLWKGSPQVSVSCVDFFEAPTFCQARLVATTYYGYSYAAHMTVQRVG